MNNKNKDHGNPEIPPQHPQFLVNKDQIRSFKRTINVSVYDFYIIDEIGSPDKYLELIQTLKCAEPHDTILIYLNTNGGNLHTTVQIMAAMTSSPAKIVTCLEGQVCSAGTFIFLKGDTKIVNPNCTFMIHNYSQISSGKGNEVISQVAYMGEYFDNLADDVYGDFLSVEEIAKVISGGDIWLHSHEVVERLRLNGHDVVYTGDDDDTGTELIAPTPPTTKVYKTAAKKKTSKKKTTKKKVATKKSS